jgi:hypothetical protein
MQPNAGDDIPFAIKQWNANKDGTHKVMADVFVEKGGTKEDVKEALEEAMKQVRDISRGYAA